LKIARTTLDHAREMRRAPSRAEGRLWSWFRNRRFGGYKFRRQYSIAGRIVDFYCAELKLAIELDGPHHEDQGNLDYVRDIALEIRGIETIRIPMFLLIEDSLTVEEMITAAIQRRRPSSGPSTSSGPPSPRKRGEGP